MGRCEISGVGCQENKLLFAFINKNAFDMTTVLSAGRCSIRNPSWVSIKYSLHCELFLLCISLLTVTLHHIPFSRYDNVVQPSEAGGGVPILQTRSAPKRQRKHQLPHSLPTWKETKFSGQLEKMCAWTISSSDDFYNWIRLPWHKCSFPSFPPASRLASLSTARCLSRLAVDQGRLTKQHLPRRGVFFLLGLISRLHCQN